MPDGRALFVPLTAPGDLVRVRIVLARKRFARGVVVEVLDASQNRVEPACPVFGVCGGCAWQHVDYTTQLAAKRQILRDALVRIGHLDVPDEIPSTPSPQAYAYRNRARLLQDGGAVGYRMRRSHRICAVERCPVLQAPLEDSLARLTRRLERRAGDYAGTAEWEILVGADGVTRTTRVGKEEHAPGDGVTMLAAGDRLRISNGVFAQGNGLLLDALAVAVAREAGRGTSLVELFAGAGLLTLGLSRRFDCVFALESSAQAVDDLRFNLATAGLTNVEVHPGRVERTLRALAVREPDVLVLDPPRTGLPSEVLLPLAALRAKRIVYLSCDPATLARDLSHLRTEGYRLRRVEAFDLFPQTPHVEALASLDRT